MKWQGRRRSRNIVDRRGHGGGGGGAKIGGIGLVLIVVVGALLGFDVTPLLQGQGDFQVEGSETITPQDEAAAEFVSVTLADTEEIWGALFPNQVGEAYVPPKLVLFKGQTSSPCGGASAASGPFYCPGDKQIYLDTGFFTTMSQQLGAGGDFAAAYVVAHEVSHAIQDQLGILGQANRYRAQASEVESNAVSVRIELQADCYSGIWARMAEQNLGTLEQGDLEEALNAARQIGDDTLQRNAGRAVQPHTFTHGSSDQRQRWFATGYQTGDMRRCDTFSAEQL